VTRSFVVICRAALIVALMLAGVISTLSYLTAVVVELPKCAGHSVLEGYAVRIDAIWIGPLVSVIFVVLIASLPGSERTKNYLKIYALPVIELASIRITLATSVIYFNVVFVVALLGFFTEQSLARYQAVAKYCSAATDVAPIRVSDIAVTRHPEVAAKAALEG
jgi:hypothetical protein